MPGQVGLVRTGILDASNAGGFKAAGRQLQGLAAVVGVLLLLDFLAVEQGELVRVPALRFVGQVDGQLQAQAERVDHVVGQLDRPAAFFGADFGRAGFPVRAVLEVAIVGRGVLGVVVGQHRDAVAAPDEVSGLFGRHVQGPHPPGRRAGVGAVVPYAVVELLEADRQLAHLLAVAEHFVGRLVGGNGRRVSRHRRAREGGRQHPGRGQAPADDQAAGRRYVCIHRVVRLGD